MQRREFITLLGGAAVAWPLAARAQQPGERVRCIGLLANFPEGDEDTRAMIDVLQQRLQELGWSVGHNTQI